MTESQTPAGTSGEESAALAEKKAIAAGEQAVIYIRFRIKPGRREEFRQALYNIIETMKHEPTWIDAIVLDDPENPDDLLLYETWAGSKEAWIAEQLDREYRVPYEKIVAELVEERIGIWLSPVAEWRR